MGEQAIFEHKLKNWKQKCNVEHEFTLAVTKPDHGNFSTPLTLENTINTKNQIPSLMTILKDTQTGIQILKFYDEKKILHEEQRVLLISTIAKYWELNGHNCSITDCSDIEQQICKIFPTEQLVRNINLCKLICLKRFLISTFLHNL